MAYANEIGLQATVESRLTEAIRNRSIHHANQIGELAAAVRVLADRLFGTAPVGVENRADKRHENSTMAAIADAQTQIEEALSALHHEISRLESL